MRSGDTNGAQGKPDIKVDPAYGERGVYVQDKPLSMRLALKKAEFRERIAARLASPIPQVRKAQQEVTR